MEDKLCNALLPALFKGDTSQIPGRAVTGLPVKQAGIALPESTQSNGANWRESCVITGHLIEVLRGTAEFWSGDHSLLMGEVRYEIHQRHADAAETALGEDWAAMSTENACLMGRITRKGAWLSVIPSTVNGTELGAPDWRDSIFLHYGIDPPDLQDHCNGCGAAFDICYTLEYKK